MISIDLLALSGLLCGILSSLVLILFPRSRRSANWYLGVSRLCLTHALLTNSLNSSGEILKLPFLMRTGHISAYLIFPFLYFFYKGVFTGEGNWKPLYYLMFLPSVLYMIDFAPFFLLSSEEKVRIFSSKLGNSQALFKVDEGLLGWENFHFVFRTLWSSFFLLLIGKILWDFRPDFRNISSFEDHSFFRKLVALWGICIILLMIPALLHLLMHYREYSLKFIQVSLSATLLLITLNLLFNPRLLYGYYWKFEERSTRNETKNSGELLPGTHHAPENDKKILESLYAFVQEHACYLKIGYTIHELAQETQIPAHRISHVINRLTDRNFSTWINAFRIHHFIALVENGEASRYTIASLARECGFSSKATLTNSFKREKGMTPGQFLRDVGEKKQ